MSLISIPNTFTVGAVIVASQHNSNFSVIYSDYNGNITDANLSASAAISDSKMAQITTAGKVSGAALTSLASIPAGAGLFPIANIASGTPTGSKFIRDDQTLQTIPGQVGLGAWDGGKSNNTSYQAATDGLVLFTVVFVNGGGSEYARIKTDSSATPTTIRCNQTSPSSTTAFMTTLTCPVKKNDYWRAEQSTPTGGSGYTLYWIPLGS